MPQSDPTDELVQRLRLRQRESWQRGERRLIESYLEEFPELMQDEEAVLDLIYGEHCLREEFDETPNSQEYAARFPQFTERLAPLLELHGVIDCVRTSTDGGSRTSDVLPAPSTYLPHENEDKNQRPTNQSGDASMDAASMVVSPAIARNHQPPVPPRSGLHVRCPHCYGPIELLADAHLERISCSSCGSNFSLTTDDDQATRDARSVAHVGHFALIQRLGMGAFGAVWKSLDTELDRTVAVKIPRAGLLDKEGQNFFFREARSAAQLSHPNIVPVFEVGRDGDTLYIVSEFVRGITLADQLSRGALGARETVELCTALADALHHAHEQGVIHRDLKPSNVMIDGSGSPRLMDFGLARREARELTLTIDGQVLGTPAYMSPEQAQGDAHVASRRSDVYSLGVILFEMLTGELPFRGNAQMQVHSRLNEDPPDPRKLNRHLPRDLATICLKCLERDPNRRYPTSRALADDFVRFLQREPIRARPISSPAKLARWASRKPALATAAALVLFLSVAGPLAAMRIEGQRRRLEELVAEKSHLISRHASDAEQSAAKLGHLARELAVWEGHANPWTLWPPRPDEPPRRLLMKNLYDERYNTVAARLRDKSYGPWDAARGHLGLAMLAHETGQSSEASSHYRSARKLLSRLIEDSPGREDYLAALAQCYERMAQLDAQDAPEQAGANLNEASRIYRLLSAMSDSGTTFRVHGIDAELRSAVAAGFDNASAHLDVATQLQRELEDSWPIEPVQLYETIITLLQ